MCFSATASFMAAGVCSAIGLAALHRSQSRRQIPLALLPLLFGLHQALEGIVWLCGGEACGYTSGYMFAFIAFCFWSSYIPIAAWFYEQDGFRRKCIAVVISFGVFITVYSAYIMMFPLTIDLAQHQVQYITSIKFSVFEEYFYAMVVAVPLLLIKNRFITLFGILVLTFFGVSNLYFNIARFSVWCFFAALSSVLIYLAVKQPKQDISF